MSRGQISHDIFASMWWCSYDIGVTGGVTSMESFLDFFFPFLNAAQHSASTSPYCHFDSQMLQLFTSSLFLAGMVAR